MRCAYHPDREPEGACVECGRFVCADCKAFLGGKMYCTPCADKKFVNKAPETATRVPQPQSTYQSVNTAPPTRSYHPDSANRSKPLSDAVKESLEINAKPEGDKALSERRMKAGAHASRMKRGALGFVVGVAITIITQSIEAIPVAVTAYGFILLGSYWFVTGLFGWLKYR